MTLPQHRLMVAFAFEALAKAYELLETEFNSGNPERIAQATSKVEDCTYALDRATHNTRILAERISFDRWEAEYAERFGRAA